jgi:hypothetical protein
MGFTIFGISSGLCWPSESRVTKTSAFFSAAALSSFLIANPYPLFVVARITVAPTASATSAVLSYEPSSNTNTSEAWFAAPFIISAMLLASL